MIDVKELRELFKQSGFLPDELILTCLAIYHGLTVNFPDGHLMWLSQSGFLQRTRSGKLELLIKLYDNEEVIESTEQPISIELHQRINEYRNLFKGIRPTSKGNKQSVIRNMEDWMCEHPDISFDTIIVATKLFIETSPDKQYIPNADNFILTIKNGQPYSLLEMCVEDFDETKTVDTKWL